jgi:pumilio RNA-binding family
MLREGLAGGVLQLALHQHGCHVIQAALEVVSPQDAQEVLVPELKGRVLDIVESPHGNHVIQKAVVTLPAESMGFVLVECLPKAGSLAKHVYGCRLLQRLMEHLPLSPGSPLEALLEELAASVQDLATDSFGNYVLQHVLEYGRLQDRVSILKGLQPGVAQYATHRCATNLVTKALRCEEELAENRSLEAGTLLKFPLACAVLGVRDAEGATSGSTALPLPIFEMAQDKYGNHIVQRMLSSAPLPVRELTTARLQENRPQLQQGPGAKYAKHVLIALDKTVNTTSGQVPSNV